MLTRLLFVLLVIFLGYTTYAQSPDRFRNFHGITQDGSHFFEAEGVEIFVRLSKHGLDEKGITKIIREYKVNGSQRKDTIIRNKAVVLVKNEMKNGVPISIVTYLLWKENQLTTVVGFAGFTRDVSLEHFFIEAWLDQRIPEWVYTPVAVSSFDFVGRNLKLGGACQWMSLHNVQCPDNGQMNWSLFDSEQAAVANQDKRIEMMRNKSLVDIKQDTLVPVVFEGVPVKARRITVKVQVPRVVMGGSNVLMVYYVTANVRNKYVSCTLSHYTYDEEGKTLAPLLQEVMLLEK